MAHATRSTTTSDTLDTPLKLFVHELSDIRSAESIILTMLEGAIEAVSNASLKAGLKAHHKQTEQHLANVDQVFQLIGEQPEPIECKGAPRGSTKRRRRPSRSSQHRRFSTACSPLGR
jgi:hypothetical protein